MRHNAQMAALAALVMSNGGTSGAKPRGQEAEQLIDPNAESKRPQKDPEKR